MKQILPSTDALLAVHPSAVLIILDGIKERNAKHYSNLSVFTSGLKAW
jgi:hypothetical protein